MARNLHMRYRKNVLDLFQNFLKRRLENSIEIHRVESQRAGDSTLGLPKYVKF
jgi:hypothetical protein